MLLANEEKSVSDEDRLLFNLTDAQQERLNTFLQDQLYPTIKEEIEAENEAYDYYLNELLPQFKLTSDDEAELEEALVIFEEKLRVLFLFSLC